MKRMNDPGWAGGGLDLARPTGDIFCHGPPTQHTVCLLHSALNFRMNVGDDAAHALGAVLALEQHSRFKVLIRAPQIAVRYGLAMALALDALEILIRREFSFRFLSELKTVSWSSDRRLRVSLALFL